MFVISSGMQKSGSGYFYNIINEILVASGMGVDARKIKHQRNLDELMKWHNNNIGQLTFLKLLKLWRISAQEGVFVVKTHSGPSLPVKILNKLGALRIVYSYRDPRDVVLSAIDHGKKIQSEGEAHTFAQMVDFDKALENVKSWLCIWRAYAEMPGVLTVQYEEMMQDPVSMTKKIEDFLKVSVDSGKRQNILWKYSRENVEGERTGMHFNKAQTFRYKTDMTDEEKAKCKHEFSDLLLLMGYECD